MVGRRRALASTVLFAAAVLVPLASSGAQAARATHPASPHVHINCEYSRLCPDLASPSEVYGDDEYVGHDEPSLRLLLEHARLGEPHAVQLHPAQGPDAGQARRRRASATTSS